MDPEDVEDEMDAFLWVSEAYVKHEEDVCEARTELFEMLLQDEWGVAMHSQHYITVQCLDSPSDSAWMQLYERGNDLNFLNTTSLTRAALSQLLRRFSQFYRIAPASSRGRPPKLRYHHQVLGPILCFYVGSTENSTLCMVFGVPSSALSRTLRRAEKTLAKTLEGYVPARIAWPSTARQVE
ncbi:hypothetical protein PC110_g15628 [Phytophthora cactorum]|uniref:Uncharacterized protein n=1 Tax=Phytophthora cactorum TaxID=29920 RepID=A0A329RT78_9STRA|nr:hypothetical protein PC117_g15577 [Phytophthora cactorum]KAG3007488.1 hypothetical protein PC119_g14532 [Phytophthora cactorum]RAW27977.1 hypothetical protein PC110_g15628 [Phytophthora cactorum]